MQNFDPGCCCDVSEPNPCLVFSDEWSGDADSDSLGADWDERAGDWDIVSGVAKYILAGGADAFVVSTVTHTSANLHVQATMSAQVAGTKLRLIIGYVDDDNYYFAQWHVHATSGTLKLFSRIAGVETQLDTVDADIPVNTNCLLTICCDGLFLAATVSASGGTPSYGVDYVGETLTGGGFGFGVEGSPIGLVRVTNFQAEAVEPGCAICEPVAVDCDHCEDGDSPPYILIEFDGFVDEDCTECERLNAAFILTGGSTGFGGNCFWSYGFHPGHCASGDPPGEQTLIQMVMTSTAILVEIFYQGLLSAGTTTFELPITTPYDCMAIDGLDIPFDAHQSSGGFQHCNGTVTCTITAL